MQTPVYRNFAPGTPEYYADLRDRLYVYSGGGPGAARTVAHLRYLLRNAPPMVIPLPCRIAPPGGRPLKRLV